MASGRARDAHDTSDTRATTGPQSRVPPLLYVALAVLTALCAALLRVAVVTSKNAPAELLLPLSLVKGGSSNIGNVRAEDFMAYGPIDVVYTWVNGTDPRWKAEKEYWHKHWIASLTGQPLPEKPEDTKNVKGSDTSNADNRFRDNEELRYSLRSLEKYAPWIRHIYVVTDGQIPSWLNIESPKINIVKHADIFENKSHLPVFSSPAIEWSLDNIPGLSDSFLYFNDDVFLGSHVHPEDFVSQTGVQKAYFAWEIPLCSPGCWDTFLQNGRCDKECNVTACDFDMGDCGCDVSQDGTVTCDPVKIAALEETVPKTPKIPEHLCQGSCHYKWLGDGACDLSCNITSCGFDAGDCGTEHFVDLFSADLEKNHTLVQVPLQVNSTYLNLTDVFGVNGSIITAEHDNDQLIKHATVFEKEMLLLLVFGRGEEGEQLTSSAVFSVYGKDMNGAEITFDFSLVRGNKMIASALDGGYYTFQNTSIKPRNIRLPFGMRQASVQDRKDDEDQVAVELSLGDDTERADEDNEVATTEQARRDQDLQELEVVLPFNVTGKHLKEGDMLQLGYDVSLRLHDEVEDFDWSEYQLCRVQIPEKEQIEEPKPVDPPLESDEDGVTQESAGDAESGSQDAEKGRPDGKDAREAFTLGVLEQIRQTEEADGHDDKQEEHMVLKTLAFDVLDQIQQEKAEVEATSSLPFCRLVDNGRSIALKFTIPTFKTRDTSPPPLTPQESGQDAGAETAAPPTEVATSDDAEEPGTSIIDDSPNPPQVVDGSICFFNADVNDPKRYCFSVAIGHFHPHREVVVHKPTLLALQNPVKAPRPEVVYEPYRGEHDDVLLELVYECIDTTLRKIAMQPQVCDLLEVPSVLDADDNAVPLDDARVKNEEEGRRMACEAKQRRLALREERRKQEQQDRAAAGPLGSAKAWLQGALDRVKTIVGVATLEETEGDIDDIEYEDICKPYLQEQANTPTPAPEISKENAEALLSKDTFGDSLRFVNKLYNRAFGKASSRRRVPSHMPFLFKKQIIREIKARWPKECAATSSHRFRHPQDMQFSFSYFHYVLNRHKIVHPTLQEIWKEYLDVNRNGILDENELLTVASLAHGDYPPDSFVTEVRTCLQPQKQEKVREKATGEGTVRVSETLTPHITFKNLEACESIANKLLQNVRREKKFEIMPEDEVTFHMLSDNYRFAWNQMLGTRARRTKFVCINDDMKYPSTSVSQILHELFLSIWPKRSQFELPYHLKNRYAHIDEYNDARRKRHMYMGGVVVVVLLLMAYFWSELRALFGFQDIARARAESASKLTADFQREQEEDAERESKKV
uniref:LNR domain-containing protein n=1 Tax=Globisporangium ultimum (strain ATCC 200006 / CBS 805.95 / DAOM BR144) TaxID=431595 RepID=K3XAW5_GLOUD